MTDEQRAYRDEFIPGGFDPYDFEDPSLLRPVRRLQRRPHRKCANLKREESRLETERARHNRLTLEAARRANAYEREAAE